MTHRPDASAPRKSRPPERSFAESGLPDMETVTPDQAHRLQRIERLERLLDRRFRILGMPVGMDGLLGLFAPVVGDTVTGALSAYIILEAHRAGADRRTKMKMVGHAAFDYALGLVPVVGWIADFFYKANTKNLDLLKEHLAQRSSEER